MILTDNYTLQKSLSIVAEHLPYSTNINVHLHNYMLHYHESTSFFPVLRERQGAFGTL